MKNDFGWATIGILAILIALVSGFIGYTMHPDSEIIETELPVFSAELCQQNGYILESQCPVEDNDSSGFEEEDTDSTSQDNPDWVTLAWDLILDEFDGYDKFYTCNGHEFDEDELEVEIEEYRIERNRHGDVVFTGIWDFNFDDNSDERACKSEHAFSINWDENDVEDEEWDEGIVEWIK